jgi:hypothetical protein
MQAPIFHRSEAAHRRAATLLARIGAIGAVLAIALAAMPASMAAPAPAAPKMENLRNVRYCEVLTITRHLLTFTVKNYNTIGLNLCPAALWSALDAKALAKERKLTLVKLNGPRY